MSVLAGAEERGQLSEKDYKDLRERIWSEDEKPSQLAREIAERYPAPPKPPPPAELALRRLAQAARRLAGELRACKKVPDAVASRAEALADDVEEIASQN